MRPRTPRPSLLVALLAVLMLPSLAEAQINRLRRAAENAIIGETARQIQRLLSEAVRCAIGDTACQQQAKSDDKEVIYVDGDGEVITNDDGVPITDRDEAAKKAGVPADRPVKPGEGAWANYDFVPGEKVLFVADYSDENVGDFPHRYELVEGNWEVIEWEGARYVRALSGGSFGIILPETLPEKFTLETAVSVQHGNAFFRVTPGRAYYSPMRTYKGSVISVKFGTAGMEAIQEGPTVMSPHDHKVVTEQVVPLRVMADGRHMKVYLGERRVANVPNAVFPRTDTLFVAAGSAGPDFPILMGPVRIAAGTTDLYDRLARDGRVATQGILFDVNSDVIRPESTPTLKEIGTMLQEHADLRISIEGHTDGDGEEAFNQDLSERRAAAVKAFLIETYDIDGSRLESAGYGESKPAAPNDTAEGRQQNRRVELVRMQ